MFKAYVELNLIDFFIRNHPELDEIYLFVAQLQGRVRKRSEIEIKAQVFDGRNVQE